nr:F-box domain-containing protein [Tanacetum cinerariifolium]
MMKKKFNLEVDYRIKLSVKLPLFDSIMDITNNDENANKKVIAYLVTPKLQDNRRVLKGKDIQQDILSEYKINISYQQAWRGKDYGLQQIRGSPYEFFEMLPYYCYNLERKNHGTVKRMKTDDKGVFKMLFIALGASLGTYAESIHFIGDMQEWEFSSHIHHAIPPRMDNPQPGRPKYTNRILSQGEEPRVDIPNELRDELPNPFYMSHLGNSLVILGNLILYENRYICAWLLEVDGASVTSWRFLFITPSPNVTKLIRFTQDDDPIVEVDTGRQMLHPLQVYGRTSQEFHNVGIEADGGSFFIGPYKESLILLNV